MGDREEVDRCIQSTSGLARHSHDRLVAEKIFRQSGNIIFDSGFPFVVLLLVVNEIIAVVLGARTDVAEGLETGRRGGVSVDVDHFAAFNVLEKSHSGVASVVLHHQRVVLPGTHVESGVLKDAPLPIRALRWVVQEILAHRCQVLAAQALLFLKFVLAVSESATLLFLTVLTGLAIEPEAAKLSLDLLLPAVLHLLLCLRHR